MKDETIPPGYVKLTICGIQSIIDEWELMRWIIIKTVVEGLTLYGEANNGKKGLLRAHALQRFQKDLTMDTLIDLLTYEGTWTLRCKTLTQIYTEQ